MAIWPIAMCDALKRSGVGTHAGNLLRNISLPICAIAMTLTYSAAPKAQETFPKIVHLSVGSSAGGTFDNYARLTARYMEKHLPGKPTFVVQHMPAAGGIKALNWLYSNAPKDGSAIATVPPGAVFAPLQGLPGPMYDATRFTYLISVDRLDNMLTVWHATPFNKAEDVFEKELVIGNTGGSSAITVMMINRLVGTKFKVISGYPGTNEIGMAMERGEVDGTFNYDLAGLKAQDQWLTDKRIRILMQITFNPVQDQLLEGVPTLGKFVKDKEVKSVLEILFAKQELGRVYMAPPDVPAGIVNTYRTELNNIVKDADYLAQASKMKLSITPTSGDDLDNYVKRIHAAPKAIVERMLAEMKLAEKGIKASGE
jgi:tripartite-type tricarboxylate transporter receptor subunit TctC